MTSQVVKLKDRLEAVPEPRSAEELVKALVLDANRKRDGKINSSKQ